MSSSKGFTYTVFAILASSLVLMVVLSSVSSPERTSSSEADRIGEASFFIDSVFSDMDRTLEMAMRRSLTGATDYIITTGEPLNSPEDNISEILVNGTLDGQELNTTENASLSEWSSRVGAIADGSGYSLDISVENYSFEDEGFTLDSEFTVEAYLKDPTSLAEFNRTRSADTDVSIDGVEDPFIVLRSSGRYSQSYSYCGFDRPAEKVYTGSQNSSGAVYGKVEVEPADASAVDDRGQKIIVAEDIDDYSQNEVGEFAGAVSASSSSMTPGNEYVFGTGSISNIEQDGGLILDEDDVWLARFERMFQEGCYVPTDIGPGVLDRFENQESGEDGLATMVDVMELPNALRYEESAVDYVYFGENDYGDIHEIEGFSDTYDWFMLDDYHVNYWDLEDLVE